MWPSHIAKPLKRAPVKRSAEDGEDSARRCMGDLRGRHGGMFRMPDWMSEDEDMSDLAHRMSHAPHFATMGRRGGPWRERRSSGGSAMSATSEDDSCDAAATDKSSQCSGGSAEGPSSSAHEIPIRIEAPAPPSATQQQQQPENEPVAPLRGHFIGKSPQHPVRTTSAVDASDHSRDVPRSTRCASAPPEMADQHLYMQGTQSPPQQQRFVSKINITPQAPQGPGSPMANTSPLPAKFNTVPKPFIPANRSHTPMQEQQHQTQQPPEQFPQSQQSQQMPPQAPPQYQQQYHPQQQPQFHQQPQFNQQYQQPPHQQPQQQPQQQQSPRQSGQRPSIVRNIPIFVEGRDGPLVNEESGTPPKPAPQWGQQWQQQQQPPQQQNQVPQPQPQQHRQQFRQQNHQQQQPQPQQSAPIPMPEPPSAAPIPMPEPPSAPIPMPEPQPHAQPQQQTPPQQQQQQPEAKPQQPPKDPRLIQIETVKASVGEYRLQVEAFSGSKKSREFMYLDEMLTRALLQLDNVDPDGQDDVRQARRAVIKEINANISLLESKATEAENKPKEKTPVPADAQSSAADTKAEVKGNKTAEKIESTEQSVENPQIARSEDQKEAAKNTTETTDAQQASNSEVNQKESEEKAST